MDRNIPETHFSAVELGVYDGCSFVVTTERESIASTPVSYKLQCSSPSKLEPEQVASIDPSRLPSNLIVIDSVFSGKGRRAETDFAGVVIEPLFRKLNVQHQFVETSSPHSIRDLASSLDAKNQYTILFLSGDTSISEFVNHLPSSHSNISLVPFPMGTGNAWATSLKLTDPAVILSQFLKGSLQTHPFPLYKATFANGLSIKLFIILSLGFHANLLHLCEEHEYQQMGVERFRIASQRILDNYALNSHVSIPNTLQGSYSYFVLINTTHLEPTYIPSPQSDPLNPPLHVLAYESSLSKPEFRKRLMKGYLNTLKTDIQENGTIYKALPDSFEVYISDNPEERHKFELCCDGQLLNLLDLNPSPDHTVSFKIETCSSPSLLVLC